MARNLVGYWLLNEVVGTAAYDLSITEADATLLDDAVFVTGPDGSVVSLDGANDCIDTGVKVLGAVDMDCGAQAFSVVLAFKRPSGGNGTLVSKCVELDTNRTFQLMMLSNKLQTTY